MPRHVLALVLLCGLTFFAGLGRTAITDSDEAFYAEAAREMVESGNWLTPHYNYEFRFEKPIFYYWLVAAAYVATGVGEAAARFPSALAGLGLALLTFACAHRWYGARTGLLAGAITSTSFGYFAATHQSLPDMPLAFFVALATWTSLVALSDEATDKPSTVARRGARSRRAWLMTSAAAMAAAFLTKGPVGIALPLIVVVPVLAWTRWSRRGSSDPRMPWAGRLTRTDFLLAGLVFAGLSVPWYAAMIAVHGTEYLLGFFVGENLARFATDRFNEPRPFWFYLPIVLGGMLPWSPLMLLWVKPLTQVLRCRRALTSADVQLVGWAAASLLFYTASVGKQPRYILPILPPLAVLLARAIQSRIRARDNHTGASDHPRDRLLTISASISGLLLVVLGTLLYRAQILLPEWNAAWVPGAATVIAASGIGVLAVALSRRQGLIPVSLAAAAIATQLAVQYSVLSPRGSEPVERMAGMLARERQANEPTGRYGVFVRNLVFYTHSRQVDLVTDEQVISFLRSNERVLCVITQDDLERIEGTGLVTRRLGDVSYFNTGNLKVATLLWPDPATAVKTVLLVANR